MKKDFDNFSKNQSNDLYALYVQAIKEIDELFDAAKDNKSLCSALSKIPPWSHYYELPFSITIAVIVLSFDQAEQFRNIANSPDSLQEIISFAKNPPDISHQMKSLSEEDGLFLLSTIYALMHQLLAINMHGRSLSDLVDMAKKGNDEALFDAVMIDSSVVSTPSIARQIHIAESTNTTDFKNKLAKAISDKNPKRHRPNDADDDLRFMIALLDEQFGFDSSTITREKLYDLLSDDLQLYPRGNKEGTVDGLQKYIQRFSKKYRT